jgi:UDP:flavonoid glycosyltransferase YjiC (YdhE family)
VPGNAWVADYLPGETVAARARLVVCNGGSLTTQQALTAGVPVLGVAGNLDQHLNMEAVCRAGAGERLRAGTVDAATLRATVAQMLGRPSYAAAAARLAQVLARYDAPTRFRELVDQLMTGEPGNQRSRSGVTPDRTS